jgi:hypothetical protein
MNRATEGLPIFEAPPVVEVVLSVAFDPISALTNTRMVEAWTEVFRDYFPSIEEKPPYAHR